MQNLKRIITFLFLLPFSIITCDYVFVAPFHEFGHAIVGILLGVPILKMEWGRVTYVPTNDWRENIMGYAGGLFAMITLYTFYVLSKMLFNLLINRTKSQKLRRVFISLKVFTKITLTGSFIAEGFACALEGSHKVLYHQVSNNMPLMFTLLTIFGAISLAIHIKWLSRSDFAALEPKIDTTIN